MNITHASNYPQYGGRESGYGRSLSLRAEEIECDMCGKVTWTVQVDTSQDEYGPGGVCVPCAAHIVGETVNFLLPRALFEVKFVEKTPLGKKYTRQVTTRTFLATDGIDAEKAARELLDEISWMEGYEIEEIKLADHEGELQV